MNRRKRWVRRTQTQQTTFQEFCPVSKILYRLLFLQPVRSFVMFQARPIFVDSRLSNPALNAQYWKHQAKNSISRSLLVGLPAFTFLVYNSSLILQMHHWNESCTEYLNCILTPIKLLILYEVMRIFLDSLSCCDNGFLPS